jgi:Rrf2 family iron-sulfur cluster assembly transcriptional regulator
MLDLALRKENGPVTLSGVAERQRISLCQLARA